jgi:hypothetical protein
MRGWIWVMLLAVGCGPDDEKGGGGGGTAGMASGGAATSGGAGGSAGGGGSGGVSCEQEWSEYESLVLPARRCDPMAAQEQCDFTKVVFDRCGCSVPANASHPEFNQARMRGVKYAERCDWPDDCDSCPATLQAACVADASGELLCQYK